MVSFVIIFVAGGHFSRCLLMDQVYKVGRSLCVSELKIEKSIEKCNKVVEVDEVKDFWAS